MLGTLVSTDVRYQTQMVVPETDSTATSPRMHLWLGQNWVLICPLPGFLLSTGREVKTISQILADKDLRKQNDYVEVRAWSVGLYPEGTGTASLAGGL